MTRVLFLDIDGVLCTPRAKLALGTGLLDRWLDPIAVKLVGRLLVKADAKLVLSSTWRTIFDQTSMSFMLANTGMERIPWHQSWKTPELPGKRISESVPRGEEIAAWLKDHRTDDYIILDDDSDMLEEQKPRFIQTRPDDGLSFQNYVDACEIWKVKP